MTIPPARPTDHTDPDHTDPGDPPGHRPPPQPRTPREPFGSALVAMVTPMLPGGRIDEDGCARLVEHLLAGGCDGLVVAGTTGEAPTLTERETADLVRLVAGLAAGRARVIAGVGTNDTAGTLRRTRDAREAGADALLLVCPSYSKPTQAGVAAHCRTVADATELPVMLYDVPHRSGIAIELPTLQELSRHPNVRAVKDARGDLVQACTVLATTPLAVYCGIDGLALPYLAAGATGVVSVAGNLVPDAYPELIAAVRDGDLARARRVHARLLPLAESLNRDSQGAVLAKAALVRAGILAHAAVRAPLLEAALDPLLEATVDPLAAPALAARLAPGAPLLAGR